MNWKLALIGSMSLMLLGGCAKDYIPTVKEAKLPAYSAEKTVGSVLAAFQGCVANTQKWTQKDNNGKTTVTFS